MIQDIKPNIFYNQYAYCRKEKASDVVLAFSEKMILAKETEDKKSLVFPVIGECQDVIQKERQAETSNDKKVLIYLFAIDDRQYFLWNGDERLQVPDCAYRSMYQTRACKPKQAVFAAATGWHLSLWYRSNRYCGACGTPTVLDEQERMLRCPSCGHLIFPMIAPAVIVGVTKGDQIILTTYAAREYKRYALIAGFTEIGETPEETVSREVMEEVGIKVCDITYYGSQPWGFDSNLLLGYFCRADETSDVPLTIDHQELASGEWVDRADIPDYHEHLSLTHEMMMRFKELGQGVFDERKNKS